MANKRAIERSWEVMVRQADPDYDRAVHNELEFEFSRGRKFYADRPRRFPYDVVLASDTAGASLDFSKASNSMYIGQVV